VAHTRINTVSATLYVDLAAAAETFADTRRKLPLDKYKACQRKRERERGSVFNGVLTAASLLGTQCYLFV